MKRKTSANYCLIYGVLTKKINKLIAYSLLFFVFSLFYLRVFAQSDSNKTVIKLASGITKPNGKDTTKNVNTEALTSCDGNDVRVFSSPNPQSEIHLSINKANPNVLLLSSNTFPVANSWQGAYWSINRGATWAGSDNLPNNAPGRGDPSTAFDAAGHGYIATMSYPVNNINAEPNGYAIQRTINNGTNWQAQTAGALVNGLDKIMVAADDVTGSPNVNNFYCVWSNFNVNNGRIEFNRSTNGGVNFSPPTGLNANWGQGANVQTGPGGQVYVCWADYTNGNFPEQGLGFVSSTNGGQTFAASRIAFTYTGIRNGNAGQAEFNNIRVNSFPSMSVDKSAGSHRGRIYVAYSARENGNINGRSIIQIRWSDNQGISWSPAVTINITNGRQNWFPWIATDATNGNIYVVYYSLDGTTGFATNTYVAISNDGGTTFINQRVSDAAHITAPIAEFTGGYCGDYIGITSHGGRAYAAWYDNRTGQWQDYVSQVSNSDITSNDNFCASDNYSVTNMPLNSTVQWSATPSGIATPNSPNSPQTTVTKNGSGNVTLTATITNACGAATLQISKLIRVGAPTAQTRTSNVFTTNGYATGLQECNVLTGQITPGYFNGYVDRTDAVGTSFTWTLLSKSSNAAVTILPNPDYQHTEIRIKPQGASAQYKLTVSNTCGSYVTYHTFNANKQCPNIQRPSDITSTDFAISPNPTRDYVRISSNSQGKSSNLQDLIYGIKITDRLGVVKKTFEYKSGIVSTKVSTADLNAGVYLLSVFDGRTWKGKQLIIEK